MATIKFEQVSKSFGDNTIIKNVDLTIQDGSFTVLVGPSGCGKTTLLRMIAGIGPQSSGRILIDGKDVTEMPPGQRGVAMVFQNYAIYPTMSVAENIEFGLKNNKVPKEERQSIVQEVAKKVGLEQLLHRQPSTLSGGQRQRVALARAMSKNPKVFLMDEPLSNLDAKLRTAMRVELIELHKKLKTTFVYVTHDQVEAMSMADTIILMNEGKIMQEASPEEIYRNPANLFTARFIGSPAMNTVEIAGEGTIGFRPEAATLEQTGQPGMFAVKGRVSTREMLGKEILYSVRDSRETTYMVSVPSEEDKGCRVNDEVYLNVPEERLYFFDREGYRIGPRQNWLSDFLCRG